MSWHNFVVHVYTETESKEFLSWEAFTGWKEAEEESTHTYFVRPKGECTTSIPGVNREHFVYSFNLNALYNLDCHSFLYTCCRDGKARKKHPSTESKRKLFKASRKLSSFCLSRMYVKHYHITGKVEVLYISTHTNHSLGLHECKHLPLPVSIRRKIQEKFACGVSLERIMDGKFIE